MTPPKNKQEQPSFLRIDENRSASRLFCAARWVAGSIRVPVEGGAFWAPVARPSHLFPGLDHATPEPHVAAMNTAACNIFFGICREIICA